MAKKQKASREDYGLFDSMLDVAKELSRPGNGIPYEEIMDIMSCSHKKAERMVQFFQKRFPYNFEEHRDPMVPQKKLFKLDGADSIPLDYINDAEMFALNGSTKKIKDNAIKSPLISLEYKLNRLLERRKTVAQMNDMEGISMGEAVVSGPCIKTETNGEILRKLRTAILENRVINCSYYSVSDKKQKELKLYPLGILWGNWNNYLVVLENGKTAQKILSNISNVKITKEEFRSGNFSIDEYAKKSFGAYHSPEGPFDVEWYVKPDAAESALKYDFFPEQKVKKHEDGSLTIKAKSDAWWEMSWYLFRWRGKIVPVKPKALVDEYKKLIKELSDSIK